jgi:hypothetical protein
MNFLEFLAYLAFRPLHAWDSYRARKWAKNRATPECTPEAPNVPKSMTNGDRITPDRFIPTVTFSVEILSQEEFIARLAKAEIDEMIEDINGGWQ